MIGKKKRQKFSMGFISQTSTTMVVDKFRSVQKMTKPILKIFKKLIKQTHTHTHTQTGPPVEVPPELKIQFH